MTILVLDMGSSSVRTVAFDDELKPVYTAKRSHQFTTSADGAVTADADHLRELAEAVLNETLTQPGLGTIKAVGMASFVGNLLGCDSNGQPVTPVLTYADTRSVNDVELLRDQIDLEAAHQRTGCIHHTAYHPGKLHWLRRTQPDVFDQVTQWMDIGTYCYRQWFSTDVPGSYSVASWSGMFNRESCSWDQTWLDILKLDRDQFVPLADFNAVQVGLSPEYTQRWPVLKDVPFYLCIGDGAAANIGSAAVDETRLALTVGTTAAIRKVSTATLPNVPAGLWAYRVTANRHLIGGATTEGGSIFHWAKQTLRLPEDAQIENELQQREPDQHGLTFLPLLAGERAPGWRTNAVGMIDGLHQSTSAMDILQAALESVALRLSMIAGMLDASDVQVMASGGALSASPAWAQMMADAFGCPLHLIAETETTALGIAQLIRETLDHRSLASPIVSEVITPHSEAVRIYQAARDRLNALYYRS